MTDLNEIFKRMSEQKKERKRVQAIYKDLLANSKPYQDAVDALADAKAKKLQIESSIKADVPTELDEIDRLTQSLESDKQLLTDLALTKLMKGETVEITDEQDTKYEPVFSVRFKKAG
ncbi:MAG: hypothetical protein RL141_489 [Candidatus Parcubacteria bacterium]|jgi:hypothetical protein